MKNNTTKHSIERIKDRLGVNARKAEKRISDAVSRGADAENFSARERKYLLDKADRGCTAKVYDGYCYIVGENDVCVTLYRLPSWFGKKKHFDGKEKIRNYKKYYNNRLVKSNDLYF